MNYAGLFDSMENGKYYFVYFNHIFGLSGKQTHVIRCENIDLVGDRDSIDCIDYVFHTSRGNDEDYDTSRGGTACRFGDQVRIGHYYELNNEEVLIHVIPEII